MLGNLLLRAVCSCLVSIEMSLQSIVQSAINQSGKKKLTVAAVEQSSNTPRYIFPPQLTTDVLMISDLVVITGCAWISKVIYIDGLIGYGVPGTNYTFVGLIGAVISVLLFYIRQHYNRVEFSKRKKNFFRLIRAQLLAFLIIVFIGFALKVTDDYSRIWFTLWFFLSLISVFFARELFIYLFKLFLRNGYFQTNIAVFGDGKLTNDIYSYFENYVVGEQIVGLYSPTDKSNESQISMGDLNQLLLHGCENKFQKIVVALPNSEIGNLPNILRKLNILPVEIQVIPEFIEYDLGNPSFKKIGHFSSLSFNSTPITDFGYIIKLGLDYILSAFALVVLSPLFILIAAAIKLDSPGPVFFRQRRHGFNHQTIRVFKFRTMTVLEDGPQVTQAKKDDDRITRVGQILRRTSFDELPQLLNVFLGEMSLVGPRPHAISHNEFYSDLLDQYPMRHKVKPGITGWAQICGLRGETDKLETMKERAEADIHYINNWTLWLDLKILLLTPFVVLFQKNAY